jgi:hypothetical protein
MPPADLAVPNMLAREGAVAPSPALPGRERSMWLLTSPGAATAAIVLLAAVVRLHGIAADGFWKNELFSVVWIRHPVGWLVSTGMLEETNPPFYYLLLKAWTAVAGNSEFAARLPSALATIVAVWLTIRLGVELGRPRAGLLGGLLLALTPVQVHFAHEVRAYALLPMFVLIAMMGSARLLRAAEQGGAVPRSAGLLFCLGSAALMHSHGIGTFIVAALGLVTLVALQDCPAPAAARRHLILSGLAAGLLAAPVVLALALQVESPNIQWMEKPTLATPIILSRYLLIGPMVRSSFGEPAAHYEVLAEMGLGTVTAVTLIGLSLRRVRDLPARALLVLFPLLFIVTVAVISFARPLLNPRVVIWISPLICLAVAELLTGPRGWGRTVAAVLFGACLAVGLWNNVIDPAQHNPDYRGLIRHFPAGPGAPVLVAGPHSGPLGIAFYGGDPPGRVLRHWVADPTMPTTLSDRVERGVSGATAIDTAGLGALIASGRGVVLYLDYDDQLYIDKVLDKQPWFAKAKLMELPALKVFIWPGTQPPGR